MPRSPSLEPYSNDDFNIPIKPLVLFSPEATLTPTQPLDWPQDSDVGEESTESESGWSSESSGTEQDPLLSSAGLNASSPCIGPDAAAHRIRKGHKKRLLTMAKKKDEKDEMERKQKRRKLAAVLNHLNSEGLKVSDFMEYIFHPKSKKREIQWQQFFMKEATVRDLLHWWSSSKNSRAGRKMVNRWIQDHVTNTVGREARKITKLKYLQTMNKKIDSTFSSAFSFSKIRDMLMIHAPISMSVLTALATSPKATKIHSLQRKRRTQMVSQII